MKEVEINLHPIFATKVNCALTYQSLPNHDPLAQTEAISVVWNDGAITCSAASDDGFKCVICPANVFSRKGGE